MVNSELTKLSKAWMEASEALEIRFESPFAFNDASGTKIPCAGYLHDFGGPGGMVIGCWTSEDGIDPALKAAAEAEGLFVSFVNPEVYGRYDEGDFKEALTDWGFHGDESNRPAWMKNGRQVVILCTEYLEGRKGLIEVSREVGMYASRLRLEDNSDFEFFRLVDSETDHLPVGRFREGWAQHALLKKDQKVREAEELYKKDATLAAESLIRRFAGY